ncbi:MAG: histone deacetylase [Candidatus Saccharicenans sp.]|nr:histone deacetylase [Candidatus Saccharicenans sp.]
MAALVDSILSLLGWKLPFKFVYSNEYWMMDIGPHVFPVRKYRLLYEGVIALGAGRGDFIEAKPVSEKDLLLVHTPKYVRKAMSGNLSSLELQALELPFSPAVLRFFMLMTGGTIQTVEEALRIGLAVHLGGGFHHAFPDHGEGFCLFNDVAVAIEKAKQEGKIERAMVVDCDLHQGNGTAYIFARKDYVFTFSIHQMDIYPSEKPPSNVDVGLWSGDADLAYLQPLLSYFPRLYEEFRPDLVVYIAGADPYRRDMLSGLDVSAAALKKRDRIVIEGARKLGIPVAVVLGGGYAAEIEETVNIHLNTIREAIRAWKKTQLAVTSLTQSE